MVSVVVPCFTTMIGYGRALPPWRRRRHRPAASRSSWPTTVRTRRLLPVADEFGFEHIVERRPGSYAARNAAVATCRGDVLAFTDSDCIPAPDWLVRGTAALVARPGCGLIGGRIDLFAADEDRPTVGEVYERYYAFHVRDDVERKHFAPTANLFTTRAVFDTLGGFDATLKSGGDRDFGNRAVAAGFEILYADDVVVQHPARRLGDLLHKKMRVCRRAPRQ